MRAGLYHNRRPRRGNFPFTAWKPSPTLKPVKKASGPAFKAVLFDIDNVLVDTRRSYLDAIRWCVDIFLTHGKIPHFRPEKPHRSPQILTAKDVSQFKLLGGFNDDWDCCYGLLVYLLHLPVKERTVAALRAAKNLAAFSKKVAHRPLRVSGIVKMLGRTQDVTIEKIERIFQEIYLGPALFEKMENKKPFYWKKQGLINQERLIFKKQTLEKLKQAGLKLGIATGRSRFEAEYVLKHFGVWHLFDASTTMDEVRKGEEAQGKSLRKPNPYSLVETAKKLHLKDGLVYIGDLPDDMLAAKHAAPETQIKCTAFTKYDAHPEAALKEMLKTKPDFILKKPSEILKIAKI